MSNLTPEEMLLLVKELTDKHQVTAYEIGENTDLNTSGVHRILSGEVKSPRVKTLKIILEYIEDKIVGSKPTQKTNSEEMMHVQASIQELIAQEVFKILSPNLKDFKDYHHGIMRALASQAMDLEDIKMYIKSIKETDSKK